MLVTGGVGKKRPPVAKAAAITRNVKTTKKALTRTILNTKAAKPAKFVDRGGDGIVTGVRVDLSNLHFEVNELDLKQVILFIVYKCICPSRRTCFFDFILLFLHKCDEDVGDIYIYILIRLVFMYYKTLLCCIYYITLYVHNVDF